MLTVTNAVTPEKLNQKPLLPKTPNPLNPVELKQSQVLKTKEQLTRPKKNFYTPQIPAINKALLNG